MKTHYYLIILFVVALLFRLSILYVGYHGDLNNQISWGQLVVERGTDGFYEGEDWSYSAPNQPPLTILLLGTMAFLWSTIHSLAWYLNDTISVFPSAFIWFWEEKGMILLMKLPGVLADLGIGLLIYKYLLKKYKDKKKALLFCGIWLFNPIVWYNSSIWGQTDSIVNLLGLLSVFAILNKNLRWTAFWFVLSILFKGSLTYFAPILLFVAVFQKYSTKEWTTAVFYGLLPLVLVSLPFHPSFDFPVWIFNLYTQNFIPGEIGYLTANAFNFWWLVDSGKTYDSVFYYGLPARIWGFIPVLLVMFWQIWNLRRGVTDRKVFFAFAVVALTVFLFMTRIHERYLYPFFPYATLFLALVPRLWFPYAILSFVHLLNLYNLFWVPPIPFLENLLHVSEFASVLALSNLILLAIVLTKYRRYII